MKFRINPEYDRPQEVEVTLPQSTKRKIFWTSMVVIYGYLGVHYYGERKNNENPDK